jgi:hypothetical protein
VGSTPARGEEYIFCTLCDQVCQWFSPGPPVSSSNKTDRHDITEILLKVALNTIKPTNHKPSEFEFDFDLCVTNPCNRTSSKKV